MKMGQRIKKLMTKHKALQLRDDIGSMYKKKRVKKLVSIADCVDVTNQGLEEYSKIAKKNWLQPPVIARQYWAE